MLHSSSFYSPPASIHRQLLHHQINTHWNVNYTGQSVHLTCRRRVTLMLLVLLSTNFLRLYPPVVPPLTASLQLDQSSSPLDLSHSSPNILKFLDLFFFFFIKSYLLTTGGISIICSTPTGSIVSSSFDPPAAASSSDQHALERELQVPKCAPHVPMLYHH